MSDVLDRPVTTRDPIDVRVGTMHLSFSELTLRSQLGHKISARASLNFVGYLEARKPSKCIIQGGDGTTWECKLRFWVNSIQTAEGSVKAKLAIMAGISLALYNGVAAYPNFKDGLGEALLDIEETIGSITVQESSGNELTTFRPFVDFECRNMQAIEADLLRGLGE